MLTTPSSCSPPWNWAPPGPSWSSVRPRRGQRRHRPGGRLRRPDSRLRPARLVGGPCSHHRFLLDNSGRCIYFLATLLGDGLTARQRTRPAYRGSNPCPPATIIQGVTVSAVTPFFLLASPCQHSVSTFGQCRRTFALDSLASSWSAPKNPGTGKRPPPGSLCSSGTRPWACRSCRCSRAMASGDLKWSRRRGDLPRPIAGIRCGTSAFSSRMWPTAGRVVHNGPNDQNSGRGGRNETSVDCAVAGHGHAVRNPGDERRQGGDQEHVDEVVTAIDGGKDAKSYAADAFAPYVFIMEADGTLVVHPTLAGQDLEVKAMPIFEALQASTASQGCGSPTSGTARRRTPTPEKPRVTSPWAAATDAAVDPTSTGARFPPGNPPCAACTDNPACSRSAAGRRTGYDSVVTGMVTSPVNPCRDLDLHTQNPTGGTSSAVHVFVAVVGRPSGSIRVEPAGAHSLKKAVPPRKLQKSGKGDGAADASHLSPPPGVRFRGSLAKGYPQNLRTRQK